MAIEPPKDATGREIPPDTEAPYAEEGNPKDVPPSTYAPRSHPGGRNATAARSADASRRRTNGCR